jgi:hypothetical protein
MSSLFQNGKQKKNHKNWGYLFFTFKHTWPYDNYEFFRLELVIRREKNRRIQRRVSSRHGKG